MKLLHTVTLICVITSVHLSAISATLDTYIVHVEYPQSDHSTQLAVQTSVSNEDLDDWYQTFLPINLPSSIPEETPHLVYSYHNVFRGFAAKLSAEDVESMEKKDGFVSATPEKILPLHTTHTPNFLGLHQEMGAWTESDFGKGVIIGLLDTGITPDHPSFSDEGMPPPPAKWKGKCEFNTTSVCNKKLIGARHYNSKNGSPVDVDGHGTHTSSTAAGNYVKGANVFGNADGTAVGIAPLAHIAIYKVCDRGCSESAIIKAMDDAIDDGVHILSLSLGGSSQPFYSDNIAVGAYRAMEKGVFVSCSAGNSGPGSFSLSNEAPWILTVGASTTDRKVRSTAVLGNKEQLEGESLYQPKDFAVHQLPLYFPGLNDSDPDADRYCMSNVTEAKGKIIVCEVGGITATSKGSNVKAGGGLGLILLNAKEDGYCTRAEAHVLPATRVSYADGQKLISYLNSTNSPTASISFQGTLIGDDHAPQVSSFSSRGPSEASLGILKPDLLGPGVSILAGWPQSVPINANAKSAFNIISGTSMSCPHLSGVASLLKSAHPDWSPAAIKSAMMTTADVSNLGKNPIEDERQLPANIFAVGSGHVNPSKAMNPGLIYDIEPKDYIPYLCGLNYSSKQVGMITQQLVNCTKGSSIAEAQLNYPSFAVSFESSGNQKHTRTVTNVGEANSDYTVKIVHPEGVSVEVSPSSLKFSEVNQKLKYEVTFDMASSKANSSMAEGSLTWISNKYSVRSPIAAILVELMITKQSYKLQFHHCAVFFFFSPVLCEL